MGGLGFLVHGNPCSVAAPGHCALGRPSHSRNDTPARRAWLSRARHRPLLQCTGQSTGGGRGCAAGSPAYRGLSA
jgi:hypothetical protein